MSNTQETQPEGEKFYEGLSDDEKRLLKWLLKWLGRVDGWCTVNKALGKVFIIGAITALIFMSQAWDAVRNLLGIKH